MKRYISDLHIGHANVLKFDARPFKTLEEMEKTIIENWTNTVSKNDDVYLLGDCAWKYYGWDIIKNLPGRKHLIKGNHDSISAETAKIFETINDYKLIKDGDTKVILSHFPIASWEHMTHGAVHLFGHVHNSWEMDCLKDIAKKTSEHFDMPYRAYNVGCMLDYMDYTPRTLEEICETYKNRSILEIFRTNMER